MSEDIVIQLMRHELRREQEKNRNTLKEIAVWFEELIRNPVKLDPIMREYFLEHIAKIHYAAIGDIVETELPNGKRVRVAIDE